MAENIGIVARDGHSALPGLTSHTSLRGGLGVMSPAPDLSRRAVFGLGAALAVGASVPAAAAAADHVCILIVGQSNGVRWTSGEAVAWRAFLDRLRATGETRPISCLNVALGGASMLKRYAPKAYPSRYHWDDVAGRPGPMAIDAVAAIRAAPVKPTAILLVQGEQDSNLYRAEHWSGAAAFVAAFEDATRRSIDALRSAINHRHPAAVPVFIQSLGPREGEWFHRPGQRLVRSAHAMIVGRPGWRAYNGPRPLLGITTVDGVHYDADALQWIGGEAADEMRGRI